MFIDSSVAATFHVLEGPGNEESAIIVCAELIKKLWLDPMVQEHNKQWVLDYILRLLVSGRFGTSVLDRLKDAISVKLRLIPWAQNNIMKSIMIWQRQHIV